MNEKKCKDDIQGLREDIIEMKTDLKYIRKEIEGNGHKGLLAEVDDLKKWRWMVGGALVLLGALMGLNIGGLI